MKAASGIQTDTVLPEKSQFPTETVLTIHKNVQSRLLGFAQSRTRENRVLYVGQFYLTASKRFFSGDVSIVWPANTRCSKG